MSNKNNYYETAYSFDRLCAYYAGLLQLLSLVA
jgi:hypothetical protein